MEDKTQEEVCKIFKCSPRSLMRWVERYNKDGNVDIHYRKPVAYKDEINKNKTKGAYERPEKYVPRNITRKVKKIYK